MLRISKSGLGVVLGRSLWFPGLIIRRLKNLQLGSLSARVAAYVTATIPAHEFAAWMVRQFPGPGEKQIAARISPPGSVAVCRL